MTPRALHLLPLALLALLLFGRPSAADPGKLEDFDKVIKDAKQQDGLFRLYHKEENLYAEIRPDQLDKPFLCPIAVARGAGIGGTTLNSDEQWAVLFKRVGDKLHLVRRNIRFQAKAGSPAAHAVETTYNDSVLLALRIHAINHSRGSLLINLNDVFMRNFADLPLGGFDTERSTWHKIKVFPRNIELQVAATFTGGPVGDDVIDGRGNTVVLHYSLCELPDSGYQPRLADDRVGYFLSVVKDFSSDSHDSAFLRYVNRWRLERAEPVDSKHPNKLSAPKKKIVFWIEKSVPMEYRAAVREGILEWNKAFEKIGFRDAIEVRQQEDEDFDPEDINYNTFRWVTNDQGFAMGPSRANPLTGELFDADIIFDASMVRFWRQEARRIGSGEQPASLIQATREGWDLEHSPLLPALSARHTSGWNETPRNPEAARRRARMLALRQGICQCASHMKYELGLGALAAAARDPGKGDKVPDELVQQAVKEVTMHEVGHTLGLRHNFKASTMLKNEQLHDTSITRSKGLGGSVMDYNPINIAPKGVKQGDYFSTTIGPYDYWAIAYAYKPLSGGTEGEVEKLQEMAREGARPDNDYATDEDLMTADPDCNVWDLGSDPMKFAQERMRLSEELLKGLVERVVEKGEGYQRARHAFDILLMQYGNAAHLIGNYVGGVSMHRDHRDDPDGRDPFVPVQAARQREALKLLQEHILSDKSFQFQPKLLRRLGADRWLHWGNETAFVTGVEYPLHERVLAIQRVALNQLLNPTVLRRVQNNAAHVEKEEPVTIAEVFRGVTDAVWSDLGAEKKGKQAVSSSVIRRNLQRDHLRHLSQLVLEPQGAPADARSLARMHLRDLGKRIDRRLDDKQAALDDATRAHLEECRERITKLLGASIQVREP
jgi:hypothetical protein